jgi:hypothetical protein
VGLKRVSADLKVARSAYHKARDENEKDKLNSVRNGSLQTQFEQCRDTLNNAKSRGAAINQQIDKNIKKETLQRYRCLWAGLIESGVPRELRRTIYVYVVPYVWIATTKDEKGYYYLEQMGLTTVAGWAKETEVHARTPYEVMQIWLGRQLTDEFVGSWFRLAYLYFGSKGLRFNYFAEYDVLGANITPAAAIKRARIDLEVPSTLTRINDEHAARGYIGALLRSLEGYEILLVSLQRADLHIEIDLKGLEAADNEEFFSFVRLFFDQFLPKVLGLVQNHCQIFFVFKNHTHRGVLLVDKSHCTTEDVLRERPESACTITSLVAHR